MKSIRVFLWASFTIGAALSVIAQAHSFDTSSAIPVAVNRRIFDIFIELKGYDYWCSFDNGPETYLVKENQCINNQRLFNECCFVITPSGEFNTSRLLLGIFEMAGTTITALTFTMNNNITDAVVALRGSAEHTQLNSSTCQISSLEVYRGRQQAIKISNQGFSLSDSGTIQIYINQLAYNFEEYIGELYRMNLSCSGGGLPESGCLFFKVSGIANISEAKFNCSVPGTLITNSSESKCAQLVTVTKGLATPSLASTTLIIHDHTTFVTNSSTMPPPTEFIDRLSITGIVLVIVGGVTILIGTVMICAVVLFRNGRKSSNKAAQSQNQDSKTDTMKSQPSDCQRNPAHNHFGHTGSSPAALLSGNYSKNPAYNIDAQPSAPQEPTYEVIPSDTDKIPQNVNCSQNPACIHLGVQKKESFRAAADATSPGDYSQNPAYGIHSNLNN